MGLSVPVVMDPLCGIARGCDDIFAPGDGDHDDGDGWCRADAACKCAEDSTVTAITSSVLDITCH